MLTSAFVLDNRIIFSRSNGLKIQCLRACLMIKRSKVLKRSNRFQECYYVKYLKGIQRLKSLLKAEAYLKPKQESWMELFCEYTQRLTIFAIKAPS